jgi:hypothetical protein
MNALLRPFALALFAALPLTAQAGGMGSLGYDFPVLTWPKSAAPTEPVTRTCTDPVSLAVVACPLAEAG